MKDTMVIYTAYAEKFKRLTDEQLGQLLRCMIQYQQGIEPEISDPMVGLAFDVVRYDLDLNNQKYEETSQKRSEAGKKGAETTNSGKSRQKSANPANAEFAEIENSKSRQGAAKSADNDNDNDNGYSLSESTCNARAREFEPPCLDDVKAYAKERNSAVDPVRFYEYFTEGKWKDSRGQPVINWKQKFITWEKDAHSGRSAPKKQEFMKREDDLSALERLALGGGT